MKSSFKFSRWVALLLPVALYADGGDGGAGGAGATPPPPAPPVDVDAIKQAALAEAQASFAAQLKEQTGFASFDELKADRLKKDGDLAGLAEQRKAEADQYKARFEQASISNALLGASADAVDPALIADLLAGKAVCDADGKVTVDGKPVDVAVKALLADKPYLAKATSATGSGAAQQTGSAVKTISRAELDGMTAAQRTQYFADGGKLTD